MHMTYIHTLHYSTLHYIKLIKLNYIRLHTYIQSMHIYIHMNIYIYIILYNIWNWEGVYSIMYNSQSWMIPIGKCMQCYATCSSNVRACCGYHVMYCKKMFEEELKLITNGASPVKTSSKHFETTLFWVSMITSPDFGKYIYIS